MESLNWWLASSQVLFTSDVSGLRFLASKTQVQNFVTNFVTVEMDGVTELVVGTVDGRHGTENFNAARVTLSCTRLDVVGRFIFSMLATKVSTCMRVKTQIAFQIGAGITIESSSPALRYSFSFQSD